MNIIKLIFSVFDKLIFVIILLIGIVNLRSYSIPFFITFGITFFVCLIVWALGVFTPLQKYFYFIGVPILALASVILGIATYFMWKWIGDEVYLKIVFVLLKGIYWAYMLFFSVTCAYLVITDIKILNDSGGDTLKTYMNMEQKIHNIAELIFGFAEASFNPEYIINRDLNGDFNNFLHKFYKTYYEDPNYTLGQILSYNPGANSVANPLSSMLQQIYIKPTQQADVQDFGAVVVAWLIGYLNNTKELAFCVSNGIREYSFGSAASYLNSLSFTTIDDIMNIPITKVKYYMLLQMPFDFMYKSGFLEFINRRVIIAHLINNGYLSVEGNDLKVSAESIKASVGNTQVQTNINTIINLAQQSLSNIAIACIKNCQLPYVALNTNPVIMNMQVYAAVLSSWIQNINNIDPLRVLYNTCFACQDPSNTTSLMTVPYYWNGGQFTIINNQNLYNFVVDTSILDTTHFYTDAVKEMSTLSVNYANLASMSIQDALWSLLIRGYVNYSNNPLVIRQNAVGNLFALFVVSQNFENDVNQVAFQEQLIAALANAVLNPSASVGGLQSVYNVVIKNPPGVLGATADSSPLQSQIQTATTAILTITTTNLGQTAIVNADNGNVAYSGTPTGNVIQILVNNELLQIIQTANTTPQTGNTIAALTAIQNFVSQQLNQSKIVSAQNQVITDFVKNAMAYPMVVLSRLRVTGAVTIPRNNIATLTSVPYREFAFAYLFSGTTPSQSVIQGTFARLINVLTQPSARSILVQSIQQTFCYGRALQYLVQNYSNFDIPTFQATYGRYYMIPNQSTGEIYVNLSAMIEDYSTNQYCFQCVNVGSDVTAPAAQQYFQDQCDYYIVSMLADTLWYLSYLSTCQGSIQSYNYTAGSSSDFTGAAGSSNSVSSFMASQNWLSQFRNHLQAQLLNLINNGQFAINLGGTPIVLQYPGIGGLGVNTSTISNKISQIVKEYTPDFMTMEVYLKSFTALVNQNSVNAKVNAVWNSINSPAPLNAVLQANMGIDYPTMGNLIVEVPRVNTGMDPQFDLHSPFYIYSAPLIQGTNQSNLFLASYGMCLGFYNEVTFTLQAVLGLVTANTATNSNDQYWSLINQYFTNNQVPISMGDSFMATQVFASGGGLGISGGPMVFWACIHNTGAGCNVTNPTDTSWANNSTCLMPSAPTVPAAQNNMWNSIVGSINTFRGQAPYNNGGNYVNTSTMSCSEGDFPTPGHGNSGSYSNALSYYGSGAYQSSGLFGYSTQSTYAHGNLLSNGHNITHYIANLLAGITPSGNSYLNNPIYKIQSQITSWAPSGTAGTNLWNAAYYINSGYNLNLLQQYLNDIQTYDTGGAISSLSSTCYVAGGTQSISSAAQPQVFLTAGWSGDATINASLTNPVETANGIVINNFSCSNQSGGNLIQSGFNGGNITPIFATSQNITAILNGRTPGNNYAWQFMDFNLLHDSIVPVLQSSAAGMLAYFYSNPIFFFDKDKKRIILFNPGDTTSSSSVQNFSTSSDINTIQTS